MGQVVPVVSWRVLVLLKLYAGGSQEKLDVHRILQVRNPQPRDLEEIAHMAKSLGIHEDWTTVRTLYNRRFF